MAELGRIFSDSFIIDHWNSLVYCCILLCFGLYFLAATTVHKICFYSCCLPNDYQIHPVCNFVSNDDELPFG